MEPALPYLEHRYYERLFNNAPELRGLLDGHAEKLAKGLCQLRNHRSSIALPALASDDVPAATGEPCRNGIGIAPEYLTVMRATLLTLLRDELGPHYTAPVDDAWRAAFDALASILLDDLGRLPTAQDRFFNRLPTETAAADEALHQFLGNRAP